MEDKKKRHCFCRKKTINPLLPKRQGNCGESRDNYITLSFPRGPHYSTENIGEFHSIPPPHGAVSKSVCGWVSPSPPFYFQWPPKKQPPPFSSFRWRRIPMSFRLPPFPLPIKRAKKSGKLRCVLERKKKGRRHYCPLEILTPRAPSAALS